MKKRQLLIATSNAAKVREILSYIGHLPFSFVSIPDLPSPPAPPEEPYDTTEMNSLTKARYYANQTGLLSLADDSGIFVDALHGYPGVKSARIADTDDARMNLVLEKLLGVPKDKRTARFETTLVLYDPLTQTSTLFTGSCQGEITESPAQERRAGFGYDPIFYSFDIGKTYAEATTEEKNQVSHRGVALRRIEEYLQHISHHQTAIVGLALIIRDGKLLMSLRNDPESPEFHGKWEFPGGGLKWEESVEEGVLREVKEEVGYEVKVVQLIQYIAHHSRDLETKRIKFILPLYVCKITGGQEQKLDSEVLDIRWFSLEDAIKADLFGNNREILQQILPELKTIIHNHSL